LFPCSSRQLLYANPEPTGRRLSHKRAEKSQPGSTRGYFAIGIEGVSKAVNLGNVLRSAHAFGAAFVFTIGADARVMDTIADTSKASSHLTFCHCQSIDELRLPRGCRLIGIELVDQRSSFRFLPTRRRRPMSLVSPEILGRCQHLVRIPTAFSLNLATAGAIVMYDRLRRLGRFASLPVAEGGAPEPLADHV
jgi:tRNA G18 (ribose-2'-O)-methylase SpoU